MSAAPLTSSVPYGALREMARSFAGIVEEKRTGRPVAVYIQAKIDGKLHRIREFPAGGRWIRFGSRRALAEEILEEIRSDIRRGVPPLAAIAPYLRKSSLRAFRRYWNEFVEMQNERAEIGQLSRTRARVLAGHVGRGYLDELLDRPVDGLDYAAMEDLQRALFAREPALSAKSVHHVLADVRTCLRWLARRGEIQAAPDVPQTQIEPHIPTIPTLDEQSRLLEAFPEDERGIFLGRGRMGLRNAEATRALLEHYRRGPLDDDELPTLDQLVVIGKGRRLRHIPVPVEVAAWVRANRPVLGEALEPLFANPETGGPWSESAQRRAFARAVKKAGIPRGLKPNEALRHCFGTRRAEAMLRDGRAGDDVMRLLMEYMGHTSIESSRRYVRLGNQALRGVLPD